MKLDNRLNLCKKWIELDGIYREILLRLDFDPDVTKPPDIFHRSNSLEQFTVLKSFI